MALTKITNDLLDLGLDTGALGLPKGTEAQRPSNPVEGTLRHNSEIDETKLETYNGTEWRKINKVIPTYAVDYLVVAGGGGGGWASGSGGGGAGGLLESNANLTAGTSLTLVIGAGGQNPAGGVPGENGSNSSITEISIVSIGGGGGGSEQGIAPGNGGSGGGGQISSQKGTGTLGQGNDGGFGNTVQTGSTYYGGGGGGAGQVGENAPSNRSGNGGNGLASLIISTTIASSNSVGEVSGSEVYFAGGGSGMAQLNNNQGTRGTAGLGGGGVGGYYASGTYVRGENGSSNTGGGGGGGSPSSAGPNEAFGGSGVIILRMPTANYSGTTTGSPAVITEGTDTILIYKSSGTYTA
jgi:hypothetical protein